MSLLLSLAIAAPNMISSPKKSASATVSPRRAGRLLRTGAGWSASDGFSYTTSMTKCGFLRPIIVVVVDAAAADDDESFTLAEEVAVEDEEDNVGADGSPSGCCCARVATRGIVPLSWDDVNLERERSGLYPKATLLP